MRSGKDVIREQEEIDYFTLRFLIDSKEPETTIEYYYYYDWHIIGE